MENFRILRLRAHEINTPRLIVRESTLGKWGPFLMKRCRLHPIAQDTEETGFMCGKTKPEVPIRKIERSGGEPVKPLMRRVTMYKESASINFKNGCGSVWSGKPERCSWYA